MLRLSNRDARRLWLWTNGLAGPPTGPVNVLDMVRSLGFLQIDTIRNVTRAHHHILWSRNQNYREKLLWRELPQTRALFEHFTHDASLIPMETYPMWRRQFQRMDKYIARSEWFKTSLGAQQIKEIKVRIDTEGALSTHAFDSKIEGKREMWARPPHKKALDKMWYSGELATSRRENFIKFYDLAERVFPADLRAINHSDQAQINYLCTQALKRLSIANVGEIQRFWGAVSAQEAKAWVHNSTDLVPVQIEAADKSISVGFASPDIEQRLSEVPKTGLRMRIINPFDPAIRDRNRLYRLFGFEYRNEMFVPKAKRIWGYYVYPLLEGGRFVGRIEIRADRDKGVMSIIGFWPEGSTTWSQSRMERLEKELRRFARFVGITHIEWQCQH